MAAGPIGSAWAAGSWADTAWQADSWADAEGEAGGEGVRQYDWWRFDYNVIRPLVPSNAHDIEHGLTDAVYIGGAGVMVAVMPDGKAVPFTTPAGQLLTVRIRRVQATNTTATQMLALYHV
jgi:hypothetical protein